MKQPMEHILTIDLFYLCVSDSIWN